MKLCMIGCGNFARQLHGPAQQRCAAQDPGLVLAACCDIDGARARDYAATFGYARHYADPAALLATERPDAVVLAVPPEVTCAAASQVLLTGIPLLLEKPPGRSAAELARLVAAAAKGGGPAQVGFNRRHMPVLRRARAILDADFAATPAVRIDYEMLRFDRWDRDFSTTAVHAIDAVRFLAGSPFRTARFDYQPLVGGERETAGVSLDLECVSGLRARLEIQPVAGLNTERVRIHAVGQTLAITIPYPGQRSSDGAVEHWRGDELVAEFSDAGCDVFEKMGVLDETRSFLAAVRSGTGFRPGLAECHQPVALMEAMRLRLSEPRDLAGAPV